MLKNVFTDLWLLFGLFAHFIFFSRFVLQWLYSEKYKKSMVPLSFWYLSIIGSIMILIYALHIKDPVFIIAHSFAIFIFLRNITFYKNNGQNNIKTDHSKNSQKITNSLYPLFVNTVNAVRKRRPVQLPDMSKSLQMLLRLRY